MKISIIIDADNTYRGLMPKKLNYTALKDYCANHGSIVEMLAIIKIDKKKNNKSFISMLKHLGFIVEFVNSRTTAEFETIERVKSSEAELIFLCSSARCTLYTCRDLADKIFVIGTNIDKEFRQIYRSIEIPPSLCKTA